MVWYRKQAYIFISCADWEAKAIVKDGVRSKGRGGVRNARDFVIEDTLALRAPEIGLQTRIGKL